MILGTIIYTLLSTIIELMMSACTFIAREILKETIDIMGTGNIFQGFINFLPNVNINLGAIIKGLAIAVVVFLLIINAIKSMASPITGDSAPNILQVIIRAALAVIIIIFVFGPKFTSSQVIKTFEDGSQQITNGLINLEGGLIGSVGRFFGTVLSYITEKFAGSSIDVDLFGGFDINPIEYIAWCVMAASLLTQVVGAAISILESMICMGISVMFGPICCAMFTSQDTADTFKQWCLSILTQFLALFIRMVMWILFIAKCNEAFKNGGSIFDIAVTIVILTLVKNSEKILNSFGLRTVSIGDAARAVGTGFGVLTGAAALGLSAARLSRMGGKGSPIGPKGDKPTGIQNMLADGAGKHDMINSGVFNKEGGLQGALGSIKRGASRVGSFITAGNPVQNFKNQKAQLDAVKNMQMDGSFKQNISSQTLNDFFGRDSKSGSRFVGDAQLKTVTMNGQNINGYQTKLEFTKLNGEVYTKDVFVPMEKNSMPLYGAQIGDNNILSNGFKFDNYGTQAWEINKAPDFSDLNVDTNTETYKEEVSTVDHPAKN